MATRTDLSPGQVLPPVQAVNTLSGDSLLERPRKKGVQHSKAPRRRNLNFPPDSGANGHPSNDHEAGLKAAGQEEAKVVVDSSSGDP